MQFRHVVCVAVLIPLAGCGATLVSKPVTSFDSPDGVPWVEPKMYEVYVVRGVGDSSTEGKVHSHGRYLLSDTVNGQVIDPGRPKWVVNYSAGCFSDGSVELSLHSDGSLKDVKLTSSANVAEAVRAGTAVAGLAESLEEKQLEGLKRKKELKDAKDALKE